MVTIGQLCDHADGITLLTGCATRGLLVADIEDGHPGRAVELLVRLQRAFGREHVHVELQLPQQRVRGHHVRIFLRHVEQVHLVRRRAAVVDALLRDGDLEIERERIDDRAAQSSGNDAHDNVTDGWAERVVDRVEIVDLDHNDGHRRVRTLGRRQFEDPGFHVLASCEPCANVEGIDLVHVTSLKGEGVRFCLVP